MGIIARWEAAGGSYYIGTLAARIWMVVRRGDLKLRKWQRQGTPEKVASVCAVLLQIISRRSLTWSNHLCKMNSIFQNGISVDKVNLVLVNVIYIEHWLLWGLVLSLESISNFNLFNLFKFELKIFRKFILPFASPDIWKFSWVLGRCYVSVESS